MSEPDDQPTPAERYAAFQRDKPYPMLKDFEGLYGFELDDGLLDVVVIDPLTRRDLVRTYPRLFRGTHVHHRGYHHHRVRSVTVAAAGITAYADGERLGPLPLTVDVVPASLRVLVGR